MSESQNTQSAETFRRLDAALYARFVYVSDERQYGEVERWQGLRQVRDDKLAGDCEDYCITLAEWATNHGVPRDGMILHLVQVGRSPDHIVISFEGWVADCNIDGLRRLSGSHYYKRVSRRRLTERSWTRDED